MKKNIENINSCRLLMQPNLIFLISSIGKTENHKYINIAPFSLVMEVTHAPPRITISVKHSTDTYCNIMQSKDFVLNLCGLHLKDAVKKCSLNIERGLSEIDYIDKNFSIKITPFLSSKTKSKTPGIIESPVNIWCRYIDGKSLIFDESCYKINTYRSLLIADVIGIVADDDYVEKYGKLYRIKNNVSMLLHYGAGVYGKSYCLTKNPIDNYEKLLSRMSAQQRTAPIIEERRYSYISLKKDFNLKVI